MMFDRSDNHTLIIAEIGNNHEGDFSVAKELVVQAAECGVDAVKFQTFKTELFVNSANKERFDRLKSFELSYEQFTELAALVRERGLLFISKPLDMVSAAFLDEIVDCFKIASGDNDFFPMIARVAQTTKPVIISTGVSTLEQIQKTEQFITGYWSEAGISGELAFLHCVSSYPVPLEQANLRAIPFLMDHLDYPIGYSDHTIGIEAALLAVALGARIIEKHFTLDNHFSDFRDHQLSADPDTMRLMVKQIRAAEKLLGSYDKTIQPCEEPLIPVVRRSITSANHLAAGHIVALDDLNWLRPLGPLRPGQEDRLIGRSLKHDVAAGDQLSDQDVE